MYATLVFLHSAVRWLVLVSIVYAIIKGIRGWAGGRPFSRQDNTIRYVTVTIAHIQLMIGYILYFSSPVVTYFRTHYDEAVKQREFLFFGLLHVLLMTAAIVLITIGSAMAKRKDTSTGKFKTMTIWFTLALIIIFMAIPWPFSPLAHRPYIRIF